MNTTQKNSAVAVAAMTLALTAACGSSGSTAGSGGSSSSTSSTSSSSSSASGSASGSSALGKVVYIPGLTGVPFYTSVACGAATEAKKLGVSFAYQGDPTFGVPQQTKVVNAVTATKPGAIMISITDPKAMIGPLSQAKKAGVKIIAIDGDLSDPSVMTTNIQSNGVKGGMLAGEAIAKKAGGKGEVMAIDNATGSIVSTARTDGFKKAIAMHPGMTFKGIQYSGNDVSKAASIASTAATNNPKLVGIFAAETNNTQGAITGLREAGKSDQVAVAGYDTSDPIVQALKAGKILGTVVQNPRGEGVLGVQSAVDAMKGKPVPRNQPADAIFVTPATVSTPKAKLYIYDVSCSTS